MAYRNIITECFYRNGFQTQLHGTQPYKSINCLIKLNTKCSSLKRTHRTPNRFLYIYNNMYCKTRVLMLIIHRHGKLYLKPPSVNIIQENHFDLIVCPYIFIDMIYIYKQRVLF